MESLCEHADFQVLQGLDQLQAEVSALATGRGDPSILLKSINPLEAKLFDAAAKVHLRFRLGGDRFPPLIYYKVYTHGPVCDIGSYAPRNYAKIKRNIKKEQLDMTQVNKAYPLTEEQLEAEINDAGWYVRQENNGWRPVTLLAIFVDIG